MRSITQRPSVRRAGFLLAWLAFAIVVAPGTSTATELRDAELVAGGSTVLENTAGTVRLEDARLGRIGSPTFVPEPAAIAQLGSSLALLTLLARRRLRVGTDPRRRQAEVEV